MGSKSLAICAATLAALLQGSPAIAFAAGSQATEATRSENSTRTSGKDSYDQWCLGCHGPLPGQGMFPPAGTFRLQQRYQGRLPAVLTDRTDLQPEAIRLLVRRGINVMPPTRRTEVTDQELDAIITYLTKRNPAN